MTLFTERCTLGLHPEKHYECTRNSKPSNHGFLYWWPGHHDEKLGLQIFLTDGRFECDWHIWILLGDQFANYLQKTGPKSDIFHGFWDLLKI